MLDHNPVLHIARDAGQAILDIYDAPERFEVEEKPDHSPITAADRTAHQIICSGLSHHWPNIPILSEESDPISIRERHNWSRYWLVDPLDGTKEFIKRNGDFTVNIALIEDHKPVLGVVHIPVSDETYLGLNAGATRQALKYLAGQHPRPIQTRRRPPDNIQVLVSRSHPSNLLPEVLAKLEQLGSIETLNRGSSLKFCLLAEGLADIHIRLSPTSEWDTAAAQAVLEAAGGRIITADHASLRYNLNETLTNPKFIALGDPNIDWDKLGAPFL